MDGEDLTARIRTPEVAQGASKVSVVPAVRRVLVQKQQELGRAGGVVMDGRDIGTVVFPDAEVKLFVDASAEERARRRWAEDRERGLPSDLPATVREIRERDHRDTTREDSPLRRAPGAIGIDTTGLSIDEVYALYWITSGEGAPAMFTGLIEEVGTVRTASAHRFAIQAAATAAKVAVGDSVSVNGVCLTVTSIEGDAFGVDVSAETLRKTTLGRRRPGQGVNLETSLTLQKPLGGHLLLGHVDAAGTVRAVEKAPDSWILKLPSRRSSRRWW